MTLRILRLEMERENLVYALSNGDLTEKQRSHARSLLLSMEAELALISSRNDPICRGRHVSRVDVVCETRSDVADVTNCNT